MKLSNLNSILILAVSFLKFSSAQKNLDASPLIISSNSEFGGAIEGASVDVNGEMFATNFDAKSFEIGRITPSQSLYHTSTSIGTSFNGIRFIPLTKSQVEQGIKSVAFLANPKENQIAKIVEDKDGNIVQSVFCKDKTLFLPNDVAFSYDNSKIYISAQNFTDDTVIGDGGLWICDGKSGEIIQLESLGRTNGVEVSPNETTLYLSEAFNKGGKVISNKIWKFNIDKGTGKVSNQELFVDFEKLDGTQAVDIDGMRTDIDGNLYVTRNGEGQVVVFSPKGSILSRIKLSSIIKTTNLEFGGKDGKTLFIVGACKDDDTKGCVDTIQNDIPGRAFSALKSLNGKS
ncbi:3854_t:CDS:1 [Funneliformis geosporum]|uniref:3699_t:CDS:1 n=1 Tax=Funneliformis geosporum TaxID=1117311 RepID=A0A9W4WNT9_9GLOM|nr:3699_t:CDS:1 [Funneliformis geosporum]CAI2187591.1 3854_t:CDS:1 [Funneliformis geosporum]